MNEKEIKRALVDCLRKDAFSGYLFCNDSKSDRFFVLANEIWKMVLFIMKTTQMFLWTQIQVLLISMMMPSGHLLNWSPGVVIWSSVDLVIWCGHLLAGKCGHLVGHLVVKV